jgi:hypothetical protein
VRAGDFGGSGSISYGSSYAVALQWAPDNDPDVLPRTVDRVVKGAVVASERLRLKHRSP